MVFSLFVYNAKTDSPDNILSKIETALGGQKADSIAFADHDEDRAQVNSTLP